MNRQAINEDDHRQIARDSLFVLSRLRLNGKAEEYRVRVRNLSAGGLMAEGRAHAVPGMPLEIEIRNIGWVEGTVAWVQDDRFGIAFRHEIDPQVVRAPAPDTPEQLVVRTYGSIVRNNTPKPEQLRKI
jgi:hypothetical protein